MSDYFPAEMQIGGALCLTPPKGRKKSEWTDQIQTFLSLVRDQNADYEGNPHHATTPRELIEELNSDGFLTVADAEASWGEFEELEEMCRDLGLSYNRQSDQYAEYMGEMVWWRPGMKEVGSCLCDNEGRPIVRAAPVREALGELLGTPNIEKATALLTEALPPEIPVLPAFEID